MPAQTRRPAAPTVAVRGLLGAVAVYRMSLGFWLGGNCRFWPSCSRYAQQALVAHGATGGCWLILRRILRCHPWHPGGIDEVPAAAPL